MSYLEICEYFSIKDIKNDFNLSMEISIELLSGKILKKKKN